MSTRGMLDCGEQPDPDLEKLLDEFNLGRKSFVCRICEKAFKKDWNGKSKRPALCSDECKRKAKNIAQKKRR